MIEITNIIQVTKKDWDLLRFEIIEAIIADAKRGFGCRFISRETGEELSDDSMRGVLFLPINKAMGINNDS